MWQNAMGCFSTGETTGAAKMPSVVTISAAGSKSPFAIEAQEMLDLIILRSQPCLGEEI